MFCPNPVHSIYLILNGLLETKVKRFLHGLKTLEIPKTKELGKFCPQTNPPLPPENQLMLVPKYQGVLSLFLDLETWRLKPFVFKNLLKINHIFQPKIGRSYSLHIKSKEYAK